MRHFTSQSLIMAELQLQHEVQPQLLNGDDLNEEREDADATESVKKKRRKKKRNKTSAPGKRQHFVMMREPVRKKNIAQNYLCQCHEEVKHERPICGTREFSTCERIFGSTCPNSAAAAAAAPEGAHLETGQSPAKTELTSKLIESCHLKIEME